MQRITDLIGRYSHLSLPDETLRRRIIEVCKKEFRIPLELKQLSVRMGVVYVEATPHLKLALHTHKKRLLALLSTEMGDKAPFDIR